MRCREKGGLVTLIENMRFIEHPCQPVHKRKGWAFMGKKTIRKILNEIVIYDSLVCIHNMIRPLVPLGGGGQGLGAAILQVSFHPARTFEITIFENPSCKTLNAEVIY